MWWHLQGIYREYHIYFCLPLTPCTIIYIELMAIFKAINNCITKAFKTVWLEVDDILLINLLTSDNKGNMTLTIYLRRQSNYLVKFIFQ